MLNKPTLKIVFKPGVRDHYWCGYVSIEGNVLTIDKALVITHYSGGGIGRIATTGPEQGDRIHLGSTVTIFSLDYIHLIDVDEEKWKPWVDEQRTQNN